MLDGGGKEAYRNHVLVHLLGALNVHPSVGIEVVGVGAEEGWITVDDPGVYAEDDLIS